MKFLINLGLGFGLSLVAEIILCLVSMIISAVFKVCKIRPIMFLVLGMANSLFMLAYSKISLIFMILVIIFFVVLSFKRKSVYSKAKQPDMELKPEFDETLSSEWGCIYAFALFCPEIWIFGRALSDNTTVRYAAVWLSIIIVLYAAYLIFTYGNEALINLKEIREKENKRRSMLNPDGLDDIIGGNARQPENSADEEAARDAKPTDFQPADSQNEEAGGSNKTADDILDSIINQIDKN